ncbi:MAG: Uma2 family endonuclease, partial [Isosphaeraceae bacterium]
VVNLRQWALGRRVPAAKALPSLHCLATMDAGGYEMPTVAKTYLTAEEYLARERLANFRSEFYRGEMFAMAGASWEHTLIKDNLARLAGNQLEGGPCRVLTSDLRVKISATGLYTYPDIVVVCDEPQFEDNQFDTLLNPRVVVEVLSDSTEKYDRGTKFAHYRQLPSVQEYVMVAQDRPLVERYVRQDDNTWLLSVFSDLAQTFAFGSIDVQVALADIYRRVAFPETTDR